MADDAGVLYLVLFHVEDETGKPIGGATVVAESTNGDWSSYTNPCGDVVHPEPPNAIAGVMLSAGDYHITFTAPNRIPEVRDVHIVAEGPPIRVGMQPDLSLPIPIPPTGELPAPPGRIAVCSIQHSLAGLTYHTKQYGDIPAWFYGKLNAEDRARAREDHSKAGDTHIPFPLTEAYREPGTLWPAELADGYDYTSDEGLQTYRAIAHETIANGFLIDCAMGGDGLGTGPGYNDPVGRTYGCGWLLQNMERMLKALQGNGTPEQPDLTQYICFRPGWDGVFYGWGGNEVKGMTYSTPLRWHRVKAARNECLAPAPYSTKMLDEQQARVKQCGEKFRQILAEGYLAIEHTPGNIPCGEGGGDYAPGGLMTTFDTIMSEFNHCHEDAYWQVVGRMIDPYHRPPDQPRGDDPNPPKYLAPGSPRGPYLYVAFEPAKNGVYEWCRGRCSLEDIKQEDAYMRSTGVTLTGYPRIWA